MDGAINLLVAGHAQKPNIDRLGIVERGDGFFPNRAAVHWYGLFRWRARQVGRRRRWA
jgi:hypothetical protein